MDENLPLISINVFKLGKAGWCVSLSPGFLMSPPQTYKTKAEAMRLAKALQKAITDFTPSDESDMRSLHVLIKQKLLQRVSST